MIGNVVGPMIGTKLYELSPKGPYMLNTAIMAAVLIYIFASARLRAVV